jgi:hypothetical protein
MGARWYDAYINHFISPDTIIPQPGNPQSLNRYAYCLNNPLRYTDPTGHDVSEDDYDEASQIIEELLLLYGIWIEGGPSYWDWGFEEVYIPGTWDIEDLRIIQGAAMDMAVAMGGADVFKAQLGGVTMRRHILREGRWAETLRSGGYSYISFNPEGFARKEADIQSTVVHELAHVWDQQQKRNMSEGIEGVTGGQTLRHGFWLWDFCVWGGETYAFGTRPPTDAARASRGEDWAYSVEAWIYGNRSPRSALTVDRQFYLSVVMPGIPVSGKYPR